MTVATDNLEPGRLAAAINDLLIRNGYPPDRVSSWWNDCGYAALGGRTPTQSEVLEADAAERFVAVLPHGELVTVAKAGHNVHGANTRAFWRSSARA